MTPRRKRLLWVAGALLTLGIVTFFVVNAFRENLVFFYSPTQVMAGEAPQGRAFRIGGMVAEQSLQREADGISMRFAVTDTDKTIAVAYKGLLPDLFKEGKGVVAQGSWDGKVFTATEVLAKHDENYMPPEAQQAVNDAHRKAAEKRAQQP